ncbi:MAG: F0F1 ATP synthase subunit B [Planctomycetota bacterium]
MGLRRIWVVVLALAVSCVCAARVAAAAENGVEHGAPPAAHAGDEAGHGDAGHGASLNPLETFQADLAIWTAVVFLILLLVLGKYAWRPILQGLEKRERGIADQIAQAETANSQAKDLLAQYQRQLDNARDEVRSMIEQARRDSDAAGQQILEKARQEAQNEHQRALRQIDTATAAAIKSLSDQAATLAVDLAGKIVGSKLNPQDHAKLIEQTISDFARREPSQN